MDDDEPSEMDESEEEIEEIVTEGARGLPAADPASDPTAAAVALPTSRTGAASNQGFQVVHQVVHRVETITSTTLPVVPDHAAEKQVGHVSQSQNLPTRILQIALLCCSAP